MYILDQVQVAARNASNGKSGFGYFMEMGLGKSLVALSEFMDLVKIKACTRMVVVCPNSFKSGWLDEIDKHGIDAHAHIFESGMGMDFFGIRYNRPPIIIINYEAIRSEQYRKTLAAWMNIKPAYIVFDESIQLKTHDSQQTKAAIELAKYAAVKRILTGKSTTQGPHDLWGQMRAIGQLDGRNYYAFRNMFCRMGGFKNKQVIGIQNEDILATMIEPHVFRALKKDWGISIEKSYSTREYELSAEMKQHYKSMEKEFVTWIDEDKFVTIEAAITKYIKLAQIQCGFIIDEDQKTHVLVPAKENPRIRLLREILNNEVIGKAIVVYAHRYTYTMLEEMFQRLNPAYIRGGMSPDSIADQKDRFNNDSDCRIILVQATAGRYGHTLVGGPAITDRCSTTIFFENTYSLDTRSQLEDRNHRRGQLNDCVSYIDLCGTPLDRMVTRALQRKEQMFQAIMQFIQARVPDAETAH